MLATFVSEPGDVRNNMDLGSETDLSRFGMDPEAGELLVTGCAGFIGSCTTLQLLDSGCSVVGIDNLNDYYDVRLKIHRLEALKQSPRFRFVHLDLEDRAGVESLFDSHRIQAVLNLAARAGVRYSMENPHVYLTTNACGSLNLLESMRHRGVKKYVLASTSSLYAGQKMPFREDLAVNNPISPYAATKKAAEVMAYSYHHLYGIDVTVVRYFTVYGPAGRPDMSIFRFIRWIDNREAISLFGDGAQSRDFTYVDDIARGTIAALRPLGYEIINLGGGNEPHSLLEIIARLERLLGKSATVRHEAFHPADLKETWADIDKAGRLLQWTPKIGLDEGLKRTVAWYRDNFPWSAQLKI
jgi:UDP-glucuronate 4-epimerase